MCFVLSKYENSIVCLMLQELSDSTSCKLLTNYIKVGKTCSGSIPSFWEDSSISMEHYQLYHLV